MPASPHAALRELADVLRAGEGALAASVREPRTEPRLGLLVAAGPRAAAAPGEYAVVVEAIREGYLLHYGRPRILRDLDADLALLAGDYLYALGLARLAELEDAGAVAELADLVALAARLHAEGRGADAEAAWISTALAVACGADDHHAAGKRSLRIGDARAASELLAHARVWASAAGLIEPLERAAEAIDFAAIRG